MFFRSKKELRPPLSSPERKKQEVSDAQELAHDLFEVISKKHRQKSLVALNLALAETVALAGLNLFNMVKQEDLSSLPGDEELMKRYTAGDHFVNAVARSAQRIYDDGAKKFAKEKFGLDLEVVSLTEEEFNALEKSQGATPNEKPN